MIEGKFRLMKIWLGKNESLDAFPEDVTPFTIFHKGDVLIESGPLKTMVRDEVSVLDIFFTHPNLRHGLKFSKWICSQMSSQQSQEFVRLLLTSTIWRDQSTINEIFKDVAQDMKPTEVMSGIAYGQYPNLVSYLLAMAQVKNKGVFRGLNKLIISHQLFTSEAYNESALLEAISLMVEQGLTWTSNIQIEGKRASFASVFVKVLALTNWSDEPDSLKKMEKIYNIIGKNGLRSLAKELEKRGEWNPQIISYFLAMTQKDCFATKARAKKKAPRRRL